jgi:hypothetical protein
MRNTKLILSSFLLSLLIFSCKDNSATPALSTKELLIGTSSKSWKSTKALASLTNSPGVTSNLIDSQSPCHVDDILILSSNGTFEITEGATKCNTNDPNSVLKGNWTLSSDNKYLTVDKISFVGYSFSNVSFELTEVTESKFTGKASKLKIKPTPQSAEQEADLTATFEVVK